MTFRANGRPHERLVKAGLLCFSRGVTSVIVVGYGNFQHLPYLLRALELQSTNDFEVVYVENGAGLDNRTINLLLKELKHKLKLKKIVNHKRTPERICWEMALPHTKGDLLIFLKGDVIPDRYLVESYIKANDDEHVLIGSRNTIRPDSLFAVNVTKALSGFDNKFHWHPLSKMVWQLDVMMRFMDDIFLENRRGYYLTSSDNMAVPRKIYEQVIPLKDPPDWDLGLKAWVDGYGFRYVPGAISFKGISPRDFELKDQERKTNLKEFFQREKTMLGRYG